MHLFCFEIVLQSNTFDITFSSKNYIKNFYVKNKSSKFAQLRYK